MNGGHRDIVYGGQSGDRMEKQTLTAPPYMIEQTEQLVMRLAM